MSYIGLGIAEGASKVAPEMQRRKEARARAEQAELQLKEFKAGAPKRKSEQELAIATANQAAYTANAQLLQQQTYSAFQRFDVDSDTKHLNMFLDNAKKNPVGGMFKDVVRVDKLSTGPRTSEIDNLLRQAGLNPEEAYNSPEIQQSLLLATRPDGKYDLVDYNQLKAMTGYNNYLTEEELKMQERRARMTQMMRSGTSAAKTSQLERVAEMIKEENPDLSTVEAFKQARNLVDKTGSSADERMIQQLMDEQDISLEEALTQYYQTKRAGTGQTNESRFIENYMRENPGATRVEASEAYANRGKTATQKNIGEAEAIRDELDEMNYLDTPESELTRTERNKVNRKIMNLVQAAGVDVSGEERKTLRNLRQLVEFGGPAAEGLTAEETGIMDKMLNNIRSYMTDEIGGKEATSAYESLRNVLRHELFGATVPEGEMEAFNAAIGTLGQQTGPVLAKLRTQLNGMRAKLAQIRDMNDAYVIKHFTGTTEEQLDTIIDGLDNRINAIKGMATEQQVIQDPSMRVRKVTKQAAPVEPGAPKPALEDIFGGL